MVSFSLRYWKFHLPLRNFSISPGEGDSKCPTVHTGLILGTSKGKLEGKRQCTAVSISPVSKCTENSSKLSAIRLGGPLKRTSHFGSGRKTRAFVNVKNWGRAYLTAWGLIL